MLLQLHTKHIAFRNLNTAVRYKERRIYTKKYVMWKKKCLSFAIILTVVLYSRTSRKRPPKMRRLSGGRLRGLVAYENRTTGVSSEKSVHIYFKEERFISCNFQVTICIVPCCYWRSSHILSRIVHTETIRDQTNRQVVAYKRLKTIENRQREHNRRGK